MSWQDQGRQEHGWFGNGTAPPKDKAGADRSEDGQRAAGAVSSADAAGARAYAWAKRYGPVLFGLARSGSALEAFADEVRRRERANPGSAARALDRWAAKGKGGERARATRDGLLTLVQDDEFGGEPTRMPGGGFRDLTGAEELRVAEFGLLMARLRRADPTAGDLSDPDAVPNEEEIARLRAEVEAAEQRARLGQLPQQPRAEVPERGSARAPDQRAPSGEPLHFYDWDKGERVPGQRDAPGEATGGGATAQKTSRPYPANQDDEDWVRAQRLGYTRPQYDALAQDPDHAGQVKDESKWERSSLLEAQERGLISGPLQRGPKQTDALDGTGQPWDVKSFESSLPPSKGGFTPAKAIENIRKELGRGTNVVVETRWMKPADVQALKQAVIDRDWGERVRILER